MADLLEGVVTDHLVEAVELGAVDGAGMVLVGQVEERRRAQILRVLAVLVHLVEERAALRHGHGGKAGGKEEGHDAVSRPACHDGAFTALNACSVGHAKLKTRLVVQKKHCACTCRWQLAPSLSARMISLHQYRFQFRNDTHPP